MFNEKKLHEQKLRFAELEQMLGDQTVISDATQYQKIAKEYAGLTAVIETFNEYLRVQAQLKESQVILADKFADQEWKELAAADAEDLRRKSEDLIKTIDELTTIKKRESNKDLIFEIRAGTGGEEASLFAADLCRMYMKYAERNGWSVEMIDSAASDAKGFKEVIFSVSGAGAEKHLKWESGAHRVQRVPTTEASGRIHTSAATVAVMTEPDEVDVQINPSDLKIDVFRSSGPGGQSVNTTDSAVRITHLPTGTVVVCQDERSQLKNKAKAMRVLRARIMDKIMSEQTAKQTEERRLKVGTGDRSDKIRTYNFPDRRVTDHRIGFTSHQLQSILNGDLDELTQALIKADEEDAMKE